jgi:dihydrofolate synthase / folylpolyglutamate synthase
MSETAWNNRAPYWAVPFASYEEVTNFLREVETDCILRGQPSDGTASFDAIAACLHTLNRPDRGYRSVHVTGTNGKTTVSRMIAALLQAGGMKVGLYTSPHLRFHDRITISGQPISEREMVEACNTVRAVMDWKAAQLTPFEFLTAAAFFAFRAAKVDYAVIEVGIGGRQDATNVIAPELSVITNVDYDHMDLLGDRLEQIAREKAGIIKPLTPVICGAMLDEPRAVVLSRAADLNAPVLLMGMDYEAGAFVRCGYQGSCSLRVGQASWDEIILNSPAPFMAANAAQALTAYDVLRRRGLVPELGQPELREVFERMELPACCEVLAGTPTVVMDSAHNAPAMARLTTILRSMFEGRRTVLVVSFAREKELEKMIGHLADIGAERVIFTRSAGDQAADPYRLADLWRARTAAAAEIVEDPAMAFTRAVQAAESNGLVVVTGSTQLAGYCRPLAKRAATGAAIES